MDDVTILRLPKGERKGGKKLSLMWIKGNSGATGNEAAIRRAMDAVMRGQWRSERSLATPAGIRQTFPLHSRLAHLKWNRDELRVV